MSSERWNVVGRTELLDASPWLRVWAERLDLPDGRVVEAFYVLEMPDYALVVPTLNDRVLVQRSYKHGARRTGLHVPAGYLEPGENPLAGAQRELLEETGYTSDNWEELGTFANDGNRGAGHAHVFRAREIRKVTAPTSTDLEQAENFLMPREELVQALRRGDVPVLSSAAAIALALCGSTS